MATILLKTVIGLLIFSFCILSFTLIFGENASFFDAPTDPAFNESLNKINETINLTQEMNRQMFETGEETGSTAIDSTFKGSFTSLKIVWRSYDLAREIVLNLAISFGVPAWIVGVFLTMLLASIGFGILILIISRL